MKKIFGYIKDSLITVVLLCLSFGISLLFQYIFEVQEHITTVFVFAVFLISLLTKGYIYGVLGAGFATFGDLMFSVIKRQTGIKDYGNLIPGHGGILDRFDSMMLVGPLAEVMILLIPVVEVKW